MIDLLKWLVLALGHLLVLWTVMAAVRTFVLPRGENPFLTRLVFTLLRSCFLVAARSSKNYLTQDRILSFFSPVALLAVYLLFIMIGFTCINWALGVDDLLIAFELSGSSMLTLGMVPAPNHATLLYSFVNAAIGFTLITLLIVYLPTIYTAFANREKQVTLLEVNAGSPPTPAEFLIRIHQSRGDFDYLRTVWLVWESWFVEVEESHTSLVAFNFLRSQSPTRSWVTAGGVVLDAAALTLTTLDIPPQLEATLCLRAGQHSLRHIASYFDIELGNPPNPKHAISVSRDEFMDVYYQLRDAGLPVKPDAARCWQEFKSWRVNYDRPLLGLARIVSAPYAQWISDRAYADMHTISGL